VIKRLGGWRALSFVAAAAGGVLLVFELFSLPVWPAVPIAFVFSYWVEMIFPKRGPGI
jgi:hypothetical protein